MDTTMHEVLQVIEENDVKFIRLAVCDIFGNQKNIAIMPTELTRAFEHGIHFNASSLRGFLNVDDSDLLLFPDPATLSVLPWRPTQGRVVRFYCDIRYPDGTPVQCVIADSTIGGGAEAAKCADKFSVENVVATLSVTPCWCYGSETFDMDPNTIKAVWGFNGTERPGAVYLAAVMAAYAQKGLPAFSIYGHDVQDMTDTKIPDDVAEKILRFAHAAVSVGWMKNKAYVNLGGVAMGIAGSYCNADLFQKYFGMRPEWVDMTEIVRRITLEIYDHDEYEKALAWVKANCKEGFDCNAGKNLPEIIRKSK